MRRFLFIATVALNAALLFAVEPMISKRVLPLFGGAPSVWNTCLMAFQALLLVGYLYAHLLARRLDVRVQVMVHVGLFAASLAALPPIVRHSAPPPGWPEPAWLLFLLLGAVGAPFIVLAAGAPLLQRWHAAAMPDRDPYFLYAASNAGSMLALLGYPLLIEPTLGLTRQGVVWSYAYAALGVALVACGAVAWTSARNGTPAARAATTSVASPTSRDRLVWMSLAAVPSSLLLGVTRYVTTDVAPVPLLWVIPLALYLLTFVIAFAERSRVPDELVDAAFVGAMPVLALLTTLGANKPLWAIAAVHMLAVAIASLVCHQALADRRPSPERLTEFFLWVSAGGLVGGAFNALIAPVIFDTLAEYPLAIALAIVAWALAGARDERTTPATRTSIFRSLPGLAGDGLSRGERIALYAGAPLAAAALMYAAVAIRGAVPTAMRTTGSVALAVPAALLCFALRGRRLAYAATTCALIIGAATGRRVTGGMVLLRARSFFGTYTVREFEQYHHLQNGTTLHGAQDTSRGMRTTPQTYYHRDGPLGAMFSYVAPLALPSHPRRVAIVGLGTGTVSCYGHPGERWTFYEIDPLIVRVASDPRLFTYLRDCPPTIEVVIGDARLRIADAADASYDAIVLDAFSSDAIPTHLLTREAIALYAKKLASDGVLAIHVSNRYLDLVPVVAQLALDARLAGSVGRDVAGSKHVGMASSSVWVVLARRATILGALTRQPGWTPLPPAGRVRLWTDDFTDVAEVVRWR